MKKLILLSFLLFHLCSCNDNVELPTKDFPFIILNEISSISTSGVFISASLYSSLVTPYSEYGLVISLNDDPSVSDRVIFLSSIPGKHFTVSINNDLVKGETYYIRAFIRTMENMIYSNTLSFESEGCISPSISAISAESGTSGKKITIKGDNFSELVSNNDVYFNDLKATIIKASIDTLTVFCPNTSIDQSVKIKVTVANQTTEAKQFFNLLNPWRQIGNFPGNAMILNGHIVHNSKGYLFPGSVIYGSVEENQQFWELDLYTHNWSIIDNIPYTIRVWPICFAKGKDLFCGLGLYQGQSHRDLWQFNLESKTWTQKSSFPGLLCYSFKYPTFQIDNAVYLYTYQNGSQEFWKYLIESDEWIMLPTPTQIKGGGIICGYLYNNIGYILEMDASLSIHRFNIWKFNEKDNTFKIDHSQSINSRIETGSFIIDEILYIPTRMGSLIQYSLTDGSVFYLDDPTGIYEFSFVFQDNNKAIVGDGHTSSIYEFCPR